MFAIIIGIMLLCGASKTAIGIVFIVWSILWICKTTCLFSRLLIDDKYKKLYIFACKHDLL